MAISAENACWGRVSTTAEPARKDGTSEAIVDHRVAVASTGIVIAIVIVWRIPLHLDVQGSIVTMPRRRLARIDTGIVHRPPEVRWVEWRRQPTRTSLYSAQCIFRFHFVIYYLRSHFHASDNIVEYYGDKTRIDV